MNHIMFSKLGGHKCNCGEDLSKLNMEKKRSALQLTNEWEKQAWAKIKANNNETKTEHIRHKRDIKGILQKRV